MANVTADDVKELVDSIPSTVTNLDPFLEAAYLLCTEELAGEGLSDARLLQIELWLSAHFAAITYTRAANEKADVVGQSYMHKLGLNFNVTMYGQQALLLDTSGTLAALQDQAGKGKKRVRVRWLANANVWDPILEDIET